MLHNVEMNILKSIDYIPALHARFHDKTRKHAANTPSDAFFCSKNHLDNLLYTSKGSGIFPQVNFVAPRCFESANVLNKPFIVTARLDT